MADQRHGIFNAVFTLENATTIAVKFRHLHFVVFDIMGPFQYFHKGSRVKSKWNGITFKIKVSVTAANSTPTLS